jgi:hypothetical protein
VIDFNTECDDPDCMICDHPWWKLWINKWL